MVIYTDRSDLDWMEVKPLGIAIAALTHSRDFPHRDQISWIEGLELALKFRVHSIPHHLLYTLVREYPDIANEFCDGHGNNNHTWFSGTLAFYSRKHRSSGQALLDLSTGECRFEVPRELFGKMCFVDRQDYVLKNNSAGRRISIRGEVTSVDQEFQSYRCSADKNTKLPTLRPGSDIFLLEERAKVGLLSAVHGPYRKDKPYVCRIARGAEGFMVYRSI